MKTSRPILLTVLAAGLLGVLSLGGSAYAQQLIFGTQSSFAVAPGVANTYGNDIAALAHTAAGAVPDVVVNDPAWHQNGGSSGGLNWGQILFFPFNSAALTPPTKTSPGSARTDYFGWDLLSVGDINGDGFIDVAAGAPQVGSGPGYFRVISGNPAVLPPADILYQVNGPATGGGFYGAALDTIDVGFGPDILVGGIGVAEVRDDLTGALLAGPVTLPGNPVRSLKSFTERFSISTVGDVTGDGRDDFAVGDSGTDTVFVLDGNPAAFGNLLGTVSGVPGSRFGYSVAGAGDLDGDGLADFLVGAPADNGNTGTVFLVSGATLGPIAQVVGIGPNQFFGYSVDGNFDLDGDGSPESIVGAPGDVFAGVAGRARTFTGILTPFYNPTLTPAAPAGLSGPLYGANVAGLGDLDGNGFSEYAVSLPLDRTVAAGTGHTFVYAGGPIGRTIPIGAGCGTAPLPTLILGGTFFIGGAVTPIVIDPSNPNAPGAVFVGAPGFTAPCFDFLAGATPLSFVLDASGFVVLAPVGIPLNPGLIGSRVRFQAAVLPASGGFNVSNSLELLVGLR
jgi:hypothetical protein